MSTEGDPRLDNMKTVTVSTAPSEANDAERRRQLEALQAPVPMDQVAKLPKGGALIDYYGHADTTKRLLEVDPFWSWEPCGVDEYGQPIMVRNEQGKPVGLWIKLTVAGVTRLGYGSCEARKQEAEKELIGDAIRNAAMRFGVALELWSKSEWATNLKAERETPPAKPAVPMVNMVEDFKKLPDTETGLRADLRAKYRTGNVPEAEAEGVRKQIADYIKELEQHDVGVSKAALDKLKKTAKDKGIDLKDFADKVLGGDVKVVGLLTQIEAERVQAALDTGKVPS